MATTDRSRLLKANVVALFAAALGVPIPLLMPLLVDEVLLNRPGVTVSWINRLAPVDWQGPILYIVALLLLTLFLRLASSLLNVWQTWQFTRISKEIVYRIRCRLIHRLECISMAEYESLGSGQVVTHLGTDLDTIDSFVGSTVARLVVALLSVLGTAAILLWMHWQLALFILFLNPLVIYFTQVLGKRVKGLKSRENAAIGMFQQALSETLEAVHQIRAANRQKHYLNRLLQAAFEMKRNSVAFAWKSDAASRMSFLVFLFGFDVFRALAMFMVVYSNLTIGEMMAVFGYLWFMMAPVQEILGIQYAWFGARAALERINGLLALGLEPRYPALRNPFAGKATVGIRIDGLRFSYPNGAEVLKGVTMAIQPGEKVALIGASGGGKSTLVQALIGLYPASAGSIRFEGVPIQEIGLDTVREHVVTVLQHPALFNDTVRANLTLGREAVDEELWEALAIAQLKDTIEATDKGLDTMVGRSGMRLSGGQRQRLAIARMILARPKVVILDEATSALDGETEARLHRALETFLRGRTTLIVAHRLSAIRHADRAFVFEDGCICEEGQHDILMAQGGLYSRLYQGQAIH
ncbi:MAG: ABC transporter ATP-binding protein [Methylococcaceae bacterium]|nr:ABC transporter ATP-binding protein [Methylococcaceae bacterium]